jgi:hypothetical protein
MSWSISDEEKSFKMSMPGVKFLKPFSFVNDKLGLISSSVRPSQAFTTQSIAALYLKATL